MAPVTSHSNAIFRFKFTPEIMSLVTRFAKLHQYDDRHTYKEQWALWVSGNEETISQEIKRLNELGYMGDIKDKMFKAGRYYFRKKNTTEIPEPKKRRNYISTDCVVLESMDAHIKENIHLEHFTPAYGYDDYCLNNQAIILEEIYRLQEEGITFTKENFIIKIKKTYKNRYYNITH